MNVIRVSFLLLVLLSLVAVDCVRAGDESKEGEGAGEGPPKEEQDADVEVEEDVKKEEKSKNGTKDEDEEELPKTVKVGDKDIPIERADRTITAEVTMEITFGTEKIGNVTIGLFGKTVPKTVRNFLTLANPLRPVGEGYKGSRIHKIVKGFAIQGGDIINNDGSGGWSMYGRYFRDENFKISHFPFCVSMANSGKNTNASQFFIPLIRTRWLDQKHVVFGQVTAGHRIVKAIHDVKTNRYNRPLRHVWISNTETKIIHDQNEKTEL